MENIYKIKIKSNPPCLGLYPSERRYSASTVQGLGVVHLVLAAAALLFACLTVTTNRHHHTQSPENATNTSNAEETVPFAMESFQSTPVPEETFKEFSNQSATEAQDLFLTLEDDGSNTTSSRSKRSTVDGQNQYATLSIGPCVMTLGSLCAGLAGLLAWKRWYIDNNIKWFFLMSCVSVLTSSTCLLLTSLTVTSAGEFDGSQFSYGFEESSAKRPSFNLVLAVNILITSVSVVIWSLLSAKIAYRGMMNDYPEDIVISRSRGRIEVNTVRKGNKKTRILPPDILNHFPASKKLAKYFPKKESGNLPKEESNMEYQERVNKFLSSHNNQNIEK